MMTARTDKGGSCKLDSGGEGRVSRSKSLATSSIHHMMNTMSKVHKVKYFLVC